MSAQPIGRPYDLRRPPFELIEGSGARDFDEVQDLPGRIRAIELQTAEIRELLQGSVESQRDAKASSIKALWRLFWFSQIVGFVSLVIAELTSYFGKGTLSNLKFLGLCLTFIALESALLAKLASRSVNTNGKQKDNRIGE
jgi:hypothetical protein